MVNPVGEIEDLVPDEDLVDYAFANMNREKPIPEEQQSELRVRILQRVLERKSAVKTSKAFRAIFGGVTKPTYALRLVDFYLERGRHPFTFLIRGLFQFNPDLLFDNS